MEKLTIGQIEDVVDDLNNFDFLPVGRDCREQYEQICKGAEQMRDELLVYKQLEEQIGCPLEVRCKLCAGLLIYTCNGEAKIQNCYFDNIFIQQKSGKYDMVLYCDYKKTWWLKADRSE